MKNKYAFEQFCEEIPDREKSWLDRDNLLTEVYIDDGLFHYWAANGFVVLRDFIPHALIDAYTARYQVDNGKNARLGYQSSSPYMTIREIKDLCLYAPLCEQLGRLIGEPMGMSLNLTNWVSTERNWHQDDYLNPHHVNGHYLAVWIALDDIHPDSGPFEFVPGSHKWPVMRQELVKAHIPEQYRNTPDWPWHAEQFLNNVFEAEIEKRGAKVEVWDTAKKGDVLIWHSWLAHRGSKPKNPDVLRKSMICHYSGTKHRPDMAEPVWYDSGDSRGWFFPF